MIMEKDQNGDALTYDVLYDVLLMMCYVLGKWQMHGTMQHSR
jgi:hypothetical protein